MHKRDEKMIRAIIRAHIGDHPVVTYREVDADPTTDESVVFRVTGTDPSLPDDDPRSEINAEVRILWRDLKGNPLPGGELGVLGAA